MNPVTYLKETISELKLVRWPSARQTLNLTGIVIGLSIFVGIYIGALDFSFTKIMAFIFK